MLEGRSEDLLGRRPAAGAWSVTEIVCHLRDVEEAYLESRSRVVLVEPRGLS